MVNSAKLGRFDQSFAVKMIRDFFLLLLLVGVIELGARFGMALYDFHGDNEQETQQVANRLAADVREIMVNSGGPVAARTLYPILRDNLEARGFEIAIEPSEATIASIKEVFDFTPRGIQPDWPEGINNSASIAIRAEDFCLGCHTQAKVGDQLGTIEVRSYLSKSLEEWWAEVRLSGIMGLVKIVLDTTLLFFLLRTRLEPVLSLRAAVGGLAKGGSDLSFRAPVKSADEFGELASDLNRFLDRLTHILEDLRAVLARVAALNQRLELVHQEMTEGFKGISENLALATGEAFSDPAERSFLSGEWLAAVKSSQRLALEVVENTDTRAEMEKHLDIFFGLMEDGVSEIQKLGKNAHIKGNSLVALSLDVHNFGRYMGEMAIFEEKMQAIAETGQGLLDRLIGETEDEGQTEKV